MLAASLALLGALAVVAFTDSDPEPGTRFQGSLRPAIPPQDFTLRDEDGRPVSLSQFRGEPLILTFLYSTCRDTCPLTASQIRIALDRLGGDVPALAVSVDPANDTPARARRFLVEHQVTGRIRFLLGGRAQLAPIWRAYGIQPQGDRFEHSAYVLVVDRRGRQRVSFPVSTLTPEALAHDVALLQREGESSASAAASARSAAAR